MSVSIDPRPLAPAAPAAPAWHTVAGARARAAALLREIAVVDWAAPAPALLALLFSTDVLLLVLNVLHLTVPRYFPDPRYDVGLDRGFGEVVQYVKFYWVTLCFLWLAVRTRERAYAVWVPVFAYLLLDDAFGIHERGGVKLVAPLGLHAAFGLRPRDFGEIVVLGLAAGVSLVLVGAGYLRGSANFRRLTLHLVGLIAVLAVFAVGVDAAHDELLNAPAAVEEAMGILEDWGEMVVVSAVCAVVVAHAVRAPAAAPRDPAA